MNIINKTVARALGRVFKDFHSERLNLKFMKGLTKAEGEVELSSLELKEKLIQRLLPPVWKIKGVRCSRLHLKIPYTKLKTEPIVITIERIDVEVSENPDPAAEVVKAKKKSQKPKKKRTLGYNSADRIIDNITVVIKEIHMFVRMLPNNFDAAPSRPPILHVHVEKIMVQSKNAQWETEHLSKIWKKSRVKTQRGMEIALFKEITGTFNVSLVPVGEDTRHERLVLFDKLPLQVRIHSMKTPTNGTVRKLHVDINLEDLSLSVSPLHYKLLYKFIDAVLQNQRRQVGPRELNPAQLARNTSGLRTSVGMESQSDTMSSFDTASNIDAFSMAGEDEANLDEILEEDDSGDDGGDDDLDGEGDVDDLADVLDDDKAEDVRVETDVNPENVATTIRVFINNWSLQYMEDTTDELDIPRGISVFGFGVEVLVALPREPVGIDASTQSTVRIILPFATIKEIQAPIHKSLQYSTILSPSAIDPQFAGHPFIDVTIKTRVPTPNPPALQSETTVKFAPFDVVLDYELVMWVFRSIIIPEIEIEKKSKKPYNALRLEFAGIKVILPRCLGFRCPMVDRSFQDSAVTIRSVEVTMCPTDDMQLWKDRLYCKSNLLAGSSDDIEMFPLKKEDHSLSAKFRARTDVTQIIQVRVEDIEFGMIVPGGEVQIDDPILSPITIKVEVLLHDFFQKNLPEVALKRGHAVDVAVHVTPIKVKVGLVHFHYLIHAIEKHLLMEILHMVKTIYSRIPAEQLMLLRREKPLFVCVVVDTVELKVWHVPRSKGQRRLSAGDMHENLISTALKISNVDVIVERKGKSFAVKSRVSAMHVQYPENSQSGESLHIMSPLGDKSGLHFFELAPESDMVHNLNVRVEIERPEIVGAWRYASSEEELEEGEEEGREVKEVVSERTSPLVTVDIRADRLRVCLITDAILTLPQLLFRDYETFVEQVMILVRRVQMHKGKKKMKKKLPLPRLEFDIRVSNSQIVLAAGQVLDQCIPVEFEMIRAYRREASGGLLENWDFAAAGIKLSSVAENEEGYFLQHAFGPATVHGVVARILQGEGDVQPSPFRDLNVEVPEGLKLGLSYDQCLHIQEIVKSVVKGALDAVNAIVKLVKDKIAIEKESGGGESPEKIILGADSTLDGIPQFDDDVAEDIIDREVAQELDEHLQQASSLLGDAKEFVSSLTESVEGVEKTLFQSQTELNAALRGLAKKEEEVAQLTWNREAAQSLSGNPEKEGWMFLYRPGAIQSRWRRFWFVLMRNSLTYFRAANTSKVFGQINMDAVVSVQNAEDKYKRRFAFEIRSTTRSYALYADCKEDLDQWISALLAAKESSGNVNGNEPDLPPESPAPQRPNGNLSPGVTPRLVKRRRKRDGVAKDMMDLSDLMFRVELSVSRANADKRLIVQRTVYLSRLARHALLKYEETVVKSKTEIERRLQDCRKTYEEQAQRLIEERDIAKGDAEAWIQTKASLEKSLADAKQQVSNFENNMQSYELELVQSKMAVAELSNEADVRTKELKELQAQNMKLKKDNDRFRRIVLKVDRSDPKQSQLQELCQSLMESHDDKMQELANKNASLEILGAQIDRLTTELKESQAERDRLTEQKRESDEKNSTSLQETEAQLKSARQRVEELVSENDKISQETEKAVSMLEVVQKSNENEIRSLQNRLKMLEKDNQDVTAHCKDAVEMSKRESESHQNQMLRLQAENDELVAKAEEERTIMQGEIQALEHSLAISREQADSEIESLRSEVDALKDTSPDASRDVESRADSVSDKKMHEELAGVQSRLAEQGDELTKVMKERDEARTTVRSLNEQLAQVVSDRERLRAMSERHEASAVPASSQNHDESGDAEDATLKRLRELEEENIRLRAEKESAAMQAHAEKEFLTEQVERLSDQMSALITQAETPVEEGAMMIGPGPSGQPRKGAGFTKVGSFVQQRAQKRAGQLKSAFGGTKKASTPNRNSASS